MDGFQATNKVADAHEPEVDALEKVRASHPEFLPLAGMTFSESVTDVTLLNARVFDLTKVLEGLRTDSIVKAEQIKNTEKTILTLTAKIYEKQAVEFYHEIARVKSDAAVQSHEMERLRELQDKTDLQARLSESQLQNQIAELRARAETLESEIDNLELQKASVTRENDKFKNHLTRLQDATWENSLEANDVRSRETALQAEIAQLNTSVQERETQIAELQQSLVSFESALVDQRLANETATLSFEKERAQLLNALSKSQDIVFEKQAESLQAQSSLSEVRKAFESYKANSASHGLRELVDKLKASNNALTKSLKEKESAFFIASTEAAERAVELQRLRERERELRSEVGTYVKTDAALQSETRDLSATVQTLQADLAREREILLATERSLRLEIQTLKFESAESEQSLSVMSSTARELERAFAEERTSFQQRESDLERTVSTLRDELERSQAAAAQAFDDFELIQAQIEALQTKTDGLRREKEEALRRADVSDARMSALSTRYEEDRADLRARLSNEEAEVVRLTRAVTDKVAEIQAARLESEAKKAEIAVLKTEMREAHAKLGRASLTDSETLKTLREQIARLQAELTEQTTAYESLLAERDHLKDGVRELRSSITERETELKVARTEAARTVEAAQAEALRSVETAKAAALQTVAMVQRESDAELKRVKLEATYAIEKATQTAATVKAEAAQAVETARAQASRIVETTQAQATQAIETAQSQALQASETARAQAAQLVETTQAHAAQAVESARAQAHQEIERAATLAAHALEKVKAHAAQLIEKAQAKAVRDVQEAHAQRERALEVTRAEGVKALAEALLEKSNIVDQTSREIDGLKKLVMTQADQAVQLKTAQAEVLDVKQRLANEASLKVKAVEAARRSELEVANLQQAMRDLEVSGTTAVQQERGELEKQASRLELREQQLRHYAQSIQDERAEVVRCTQQLAGEIQAARNMNPLEDYLKLTEFELSKIELQLKKTPTLSSERPKLEKFLNQMMEQREFLKGVIAQSKANLDQQSKKLALIVDAARLSPLPPLPPKRK